jgi:hypothetical protein
VENSQKKGSHTRQKSDLRNIGDLLREAMEPLLGKAAAAQTSKQQPVNSGEPSGRYDFDLAEFPIFKLDRKAIHNYEPNTPLIYEDTIRGKEGEVVTRTWKVYPSRHGFGGPTTMMLLYDILQLYVEQGASGRHIRFGTLRSLFLRRGKRNPSDRDYKRMERDLDILRGLDFHCENAFWDNERQAYVSMKWRLFDNVVFFKEKAKSFQVELPFGFIEANSVLQAIAKSRGFFAIGFPSEVFYELKPLEQRLALYLAKRFKSEKVHFRVVETLAKSLPIEAAAERNIRAALKQAAQGLLDKKLPILESFTIEKSERGRWVATFRRKELPRDAPHPKEKRELLPPDIQELVNRLIEASGEPEDWRWWAQCSHAIGREGVFRALGQFEEKRRLEELRNPGAMLTAILKDIARQQKVTIH